MMGKLQLQSHGNRRDAILAKASGTFYDFKISKGSRKGFPGNCERLIYSLDSVVHMSVSLNETDKPLTP